MLSIAQYEDSSEESDDGDNGSQVTTTTTTSVSVSSSNYETPRVVLPPTKSGELLKNVSSLDEEDGEEEQGDDAVRPSTTARVSSSLFASLPAPKNRPVSVAAAGPLGLLPESEDDVTVALPARLTPTGLPPGQSKAFKSVKITVPSLAEFDDDNETTVKKRRMATGSGLVASLPPPKNSVTKTANRLLLPYTLSRKPAAPLASTLPKPKSSQAPVTVPTSSTTKPIIDSAYDDSDEDDGEEVPPTDFFSLDKVGKDVVDIDELVPEPAQSSQSDVGQAKTTTWQSSSTSSDYEAAGDYNVPSSSSDPGTGYSQLPSADDPQALLQDAGFLRLRGKKRGNAEDINFIDVSQDDQLPNTEEWMAKSLTEETGYRPSRKNGAMPTSQQRRKHQITYLAFQAKERELELKNQWAQNRQTKYQTQSKYGF